MVTGVMDEEVSPSAVRHTMSMNRPLSPGTRNTSFTTDVSADMSGGVITATVCMGFGVIGVI